MSSASLSPDRSEGRNINAFHFEGLRKKPFAAMMKAVIPYRDMSIQPYYILRRCPNWDESDIDRWVARGEETKKLPAAYNLVDKWKDMRVEHSEYMLEFQCMINTLRLATNRAQAIFSSVQQNLAHAETPQCRQDVGLKGKSYVEILSRGFKLLAKWQCLIREHVSWKLLNHSSRVPPEEADRFKGIRGIEYAKAIRWNLSKEELPVIIDIVSMIKTLYGLMLRAEAVRLTFDRRFMNVFKSLFVSSCAARRTEETSGKQSWEIQV